MHLSVERVAFLLLVSAVIAMLSRRLHLPYSVGLVVAGIGIAFLPVSLGINLTGDLLFTVLLPPLIFEAALTLSWAALRRNLSVVVVLAILGVALSTVTSAAGMRYFAGWSWSAALIFGALISATDPVSVIAAFKEAGVKGRLRLLIESESLLNDGTAAVAFTVCTEIAMGHASTPIAVAGRLIVTLAGSVVCGGMVAGAALLLCGRTDDHLVEITFTTITAYGSFLLAERFQLSGVLATLVAGLILGTAGSRGIISNRGRESVLAFWEYAAFAANSMVFLLIGIRDASEDFSMRWKLLAVAILIVLVSRAVAVYPCCALFRSSDLRISFRHQHVLCWGGLRGALALALALALPRTVAGREAIISAAFGIVAFSVFVQSLTLIPMLRAFGELPRISS